MAIEDLDLEARNVSVAVTGGLVYGDMSTVTAIDSPLPVGAKQVGYITEEGVTISKESDSTDIFAWQGAVKVRTIRNNGSLTVTLSILENRKESRELYWGAEEVDGVIKVKSTAMLTDGILLDYFDNSDEVGAVNHTRIVIPRANIVGTGEVVLVSNDAIKYEITITALGGSDGSEATIYTGVVEAPAG